MRGQDGKYTFNYQWFTMVGAERFELPTLCSQSRCATRLRYAPTFLFDCIAKLDAGWRAMFVLPSLGRLCSMPEADRLSRHTPAATTRRSRFNATIERECGGYSSAAERLTVAQDVMGSIPISRPNLPCRYALCPLCTTTESQ